MKLFSYAWMAVALTGCLNSPLLNHADAATASDQSQNSNGCAINLTKENLCASLTWEKQPTEDDMGEFVLRFWDAQKGTESGPYLTAPDAVAVKLWMPSMGHGSSPVAVSPMHDSGNQVIPGVYDATNVYFVMPGAWQILIQLKQGSNIVDQATLDIQI
jgi:hypothetical protein